MYLVDTNVLILGIAQKEPDYSFLQKAILKRSLYLSVITLGEFLSQSSKEEDVELEKLIARFPVLEVNLDVAKLAAKYRKKFLKTRRAQLLDYFLAAQARLNGLILVTNNKSDFPMKDIKVI